MASRESYTPRTLRPMVRTGQEAALGSISLDQAPDRHFRRKHRRLHCGFRLRARLSIAINSADRRLGFSNCLRIRSTAGLKTAETAVLACPALLISVQEERKGLRLTACDSPSPLPCLFLSVSSSSS